MDLAGTTRQITSDSADECRMSLRNCIGREANIKKATEMIIRWAKEIDA